MRTRGIEMFITHFRHRKKVDDFSKEQTNIWRGVTRFCVKNYDNLLEMFWKRDNFVIWKVNINKI